MAEELLTKLFEIETTVEVSMYDLLDNFNDAEKRELARELVDGDKDLNIGEPSLEDEYKYKYFAQVQDDYSLEELEQLLPDKKG
jgi:hypothetical protein